MDLSSIQQQLIKLGFDNDSKTQLDVSKFQPGSKLLATVIASYPLDKPRLIEYLKTSNESIAQSPQENPPTPQPEKSTQQLLETILKKPELYAVRLKVLGKTLLSFSEQVLRTGDKVQLTVKNDKQLTYSLKPTTNGPLTPSNTAQTVTRLNAPTINESTIQAKPPHADLALLKSGLKHYLPAQENLTETLKQLTRITGSATIANSQHSISPQTTQQTVRAIQSIVDKTLTIEKAQLPATLKKALENSGAFFESKMAALKNAQSGEALPNTLKDDTKFELLRAVHSLTTIMSSGLKTEGQTPANTLDKLVRSLLLPGQYAQQANEQKQLTQATLKHVYSSLAKISSLQIQHLIQAHSEPGFSNSGGFFDLPIRVGEYLFPLTLHIQEKIPEDNYQETEKHSAKKDKSKLKRQWQVYMEFDLDELGMFASDIAVEDNNVKTKLWIQSSALWSASQNHLAPLKDELESHGIDVTELSCFHSTPPAKTVKIDSSLIDVRT